MRVDVNIKKLTETAVLPTRGSAQAAGYDLYADKRQDGADVYFVAPGNCESIGTGVAVCIPDGYFGAVFARSGLAKNKHVRPANCVGVIDSDYRGEIKVLMHNDDLKVPVVIESGQRIAQLVVIPYAELNFNEVEDLDETSRGEGGFGSTGV